MPIISTCHKIYSPDLNTPRHCFFTDEQNP